MAKIDHKYWYLIGGIAVGFVIRDTFGDGWAAIAILLVGYAGRWILGKILSPIFDFGADKAKKETNRLLRDPVKIAIWEHQKRHHKGSWKRCRRVECKIPR